MTGKPQHALVIDDEPLITTLVATVLREDGWEVKEAASAEQAFEMLRDLGLVCGFLRCPTRRS